MSALKSPSFRQPKCSSTVSIGELADLIHHSADCVEFVKTAPIIYVADEDNSFMLRLQSVQGPAADESAVTLARKVLTVLREAGLMATARVPGGSGDFLAVFPKSVSGTSRKKSKKGGAN